MQDDNAGRRDGPPEVPLSIQVIAGVGGVLLLVGITLLGVSRLDNGTWGTLGDPPAHLMILGVVMMAGAALSYAVHR